MENSNHKTKHQLLDENQHLKAQISSLKTNEKTQADINNLEFNWKTTFDAITDSVSIIDLQSRMLICNSATHSIFDFNKDDLNKKKCHELVHGTCTPYKNCPIARMKKSKKHETMVYNEKDKWFEVKVDPIFDTKKKLIGGVHVVSDITERKQTEIALISSEEKYRSLISILASVVWVTDSDGQFVNTQHMFEKFTGQTWDEHKGWGWIDMIHPDDRDRMSKRWVIAEKRKTTFHSNGRIMRANGEYCFFEAVATPILGSDGEFKEWVGTFTDITKRKEVENELKKQHQYLEEKVKERTKDLERQNKKLDDAVKVFVGREIKIRKLNKRIKLLEKG